MASAQRVQGLSQMVLDPHIHTSRGNVHMLMHIAVRIRNNNYY